MKPSPASDRHRDRNSVALRALIDEAAARISVRTGTLVPEGSRFLGAPASAAPAPMHGHASEEAVRFLTRIERELCAPLVSGDRVLIGMRAVKIGVAAPGSAARDQAGNLVKYGYGSRYAAGTSADIAGLDDDVLERTGEATTIVATILQASVSHVLATMRIVTGAKVPFPTYFDMANGRWPHEHSASDLPGEFCRLAYHPAFDRIQQASSRSSRDASQLYKRIIIRKFFAYGHRLLEARGASGAYFVASPRVVRFLVGSGLRIAPLEGAIASQSPAATSIRRAFPGYWRPDDAAAAPRVFLSDRGFDDVICEVGPRCVRLLGARQARVVDADPHKVLRPARPSPVIRRSR